LQHDVEDASQERDDDGAAKAKKGSTRRHLHATQEFSKVNVADDGYQSSARESQKTELHAIHAGGEPTFADDEAQSLSKLGDFEAALAAQRVAGGLPEPSPISMRGPSSKPAMTKGSHHHQPPQDDQGQAGRAAEQHLEHSLGQSHRALIEMASGKQGSNTSRGLTEANNFSPGLSPRNVIEGGASTHYAKLLSKPTMAELSPDHFAETTERQRYAPLTSTVYQNNQLDLAGALSKQGLRR